MLVVVRENDGGGGGLKGDLGCSDRMALTSVTLENDDGQEAAGEEGP